MRSPPLSSRAAAPGRRRTGPTSARRRRRGADRARRAGAHGVRRQAAPPRGVRRADAGHRCADQGARMSGHTVEVREEDAFDVDAVTSWLADNADGIPDGKPDVRQFPGGASNLTYL